MRRLGSHNRGKMRLLAAMSPVAVVGVQRRGTSSQQQQAPAGAAAGSTVTAPPPRAALDELLSRLRKMSGGESTGAPPAACHAAASSLPSAPHASAAATITDSHQRDHRSQRIQRRRGSTSLTDARNSNHREFTTNNNFDTKNHNRNRRDVSNSRTQPRRSLQHSVPEESSRDQRRQKAPSSNPSRPTSLPSNPPRHDKSDRNNTPPARHLSSSDTSAPSTSSLKLINPFSNVKYSARDRINWAETIQLHDGVQKLRQQVLELLASSSPSATHYTPVELKGILSPLANHLGGLPLDLHTVMQWLPFVDRSKLGRGLDQLMCSNGATTDPSDLFVFTNPFPATPSVTTQDEGHSTADSSVNWDDLIVLDASLPTFSALYAQGLHLSWEPIEVIARRFGFAGNVVPTADLIKFIEQLNQRHRQPLNPGSGLVANLVDIAVLHRLTNATQLPLSQAYSTEPLTSSVTIRPETVIVVRRGSHAFWWDAQSGETHQPAASWNESPPPMSVVEVTRMMGEPFVAPSSKSQRASILLAVDAKSATARNTGGVPPRAAGGRSTGQLPDAAIAQQYPFYFLGLQLQHHKQPTVYSTHNNERPSISSGVYRQQATSTRINIFSVPPRYLVAPDEARALSAASPPQSVSASPDAQRKQPAATGSGTESSSTTGTSTRQIHELKVKIVNLKQRARLARGEARVAILEELAAARNKLNEWLSVERREGSQAPISNRKAPSLAVKSAQPTDHADAVSQSPKLDALSEASTAKQEQVTTEVASTEKIVESTPEGAANELSPAQKPPSEPPLTEEFAHPTKSPGSGSEAEAPKKRRKVHQGGRAEKKGTTTSGRPRRYGGAKSYVAAEARTSPATSVSV